MAPYASQVRGPTGKAGHYYGHHYCDHYRDQATATQTPPRYGANAHSSTAGLLLYYSNTKQPLPVET
jgi:hypothetical protein